MSDLIGIAIYIAGWVLCYRLVYVAVIQSDTMGYGDIDNEDRLMAAFFAALSATLWPITFAFLLVFRFLTPTSPREREDALYEREQAAAERERRIRDMERDLGIGDQR